CFARSSCSSSFCSCALYHCHLHSSPTRRSSDLLSQRVDVRGIGFDDVGEFAAPVLDELGIVLDGHDLPPQPGQGGGRSWPSSTIDRKSTRLNSSHVSISYAVFSL